MATIHDLLTTPIGMCESSNDHCEAGPREFCTYHRTPDDLQELLAPLAEVRELLIQADSLISVVRHRESPRPQTKVDADRLIPMLRRAYEGRA